MGLASLNAVGIPSRPRGGGDPNGAAPLDKKGVYEEGQRQKAGSAVLSPIVWGYVLLVGLSKTSRQKIVFLRVKIKVFFFFPKEIIYPEILDPCF